MEWKKLSYKKKISLIFLISDFILIISMFPFYLLQIINTTNFVILKAILQGISYLSIAYPLSFSFFKIFSSLTGCELKGVGCMNAAFFGIFFGIFISLFIYFVVGFFIGWILDKNKKN